ncbi:MAG TPA: chitobiase/beta-hexosaminidase C-terminal domain-containing protein, partial [Spirochaetia bacterium]|nr:chitobiase/beta-hexosaminidase C-terminal domain-containing protein [Spirochaetia bacterium]
TLVLHAVAIGPNMVPSTPVSATVIVSPYPIFSVSVSPASFSEDGGTATFTISSSVTPSAAIPFSVATGGTYTGTSQATSPTTGFGGPGAVMNLTMAANTTTVTVTVTGVHDSAHVSPTISLAVKPDTTNTPPTYSVGTSATATIQDDGANALTYNANGGTGSAPAAGNYAPGALVTVQGAGTLTRAGFSFGGWVDVNGVAYSVGQTFTMPNAAMELIAVWNPLPVAASPSISVAGGTYGTAQTVALSTATGGATIRYTTDGTVPTETNGTIYTGPITISSYAVLQAIAYEAGFVDSPVAAATYVILSSLAGPWGVTVPTFPVRPSDVVVVDAVTYRITGGWVWDGLYQVQSGSLVMTQPDNMTYTGFVWTINSQQLLTMTSAGSGAGYVGTTMTR